MAQLFFELEILMPDATAQATVWQRHREEVLVVNWRLEPLTAQPTQPTSQQRSTRWASSAYRALEYRWNFQAACQA